MAFVVPGAKQRGEWKDSQTIHLNQIYATVCQLYGIDYKIFDANVGQPINIQ